MPGDRCVVCGNSKAKDPSISMHRFPSDAKKKQRWCEIFDMSYDDVKAYHRVCSRHFKDGNVQNGPDRTLGKHFASPKKPWTARSQRAKQRDVTRTAQALFSSTPKASEVPSASPTPTLTSESPMTVSMGESLITDYQVHELCNDPPSDTSTHVSTPQTQAVLSSRSNSEVLVNTALLARIEVLESENKMLKEKVKTQESKRVHFRIENITHDDKLVRLYTGFISFMVLMSFFEFLGPSVNELSYWGGRQVTQRKRQRLTKLTPLNQFFLTLVKLKLNLQVRDLAFRFGISKSLVSKYVITWICFLYQYLREIQWMPCTAQVMGTLPHAFKAKYPTTFAIIDGSELFIETPSDLCVQSSTWSNYKHHNTFKFLVACSPNGAISYISPLYVGSISDVELTRVCGFLEKLEGRSGISIMADRGFTVKDMLANIGVELNIPPFMEGRKQLPAEEVERGRGIASLRIHVERAIGRMKTYSIMKGTLPNTLSRVANQIVSVCAWLTNFQPSLVPPPQECKDVDVQEYFDNMEDTDSEHSSASSDDEL